MRLHHIRVTIADSIADAAVPDVRLEQTCTWNVKFFV